MKGQSQATPQPIYHPGTLCCAVCRWIPRIFGSLHRKVLVLLLLLSLGLVLLSLVYSQYPYVFVGLRPLTLPWRSHETSMTQNFPQCIIVGVRKCGTRALLEFLSMHPDVQHNDIEMHFFNRDERYALGLNWYRQKMPLALPGQITMEKTPGYFISSEAPARIRQMNDSIKLLLIVRDPVTRTLSDYVQVATNHRKKNMSYPAFEELVIDADTGEVDTEYKPVWISLYYLHWLNWQQYFNASQLHLVDGDRLLTDPVPELKKVESFLGLRPHLSSEHFYFNKTRGFFCLNQPGSSRCLNLSKGRPHPEVRPRVLHKLYRFFNAHNERFFKMVGQYFDWTEETRRKRPGKS